MNLTLIKRAVQGFLGGQGVPTVKVDTIAENTSGSGVTISDAVSMGSTLAVTGAITATGGVARTGQQRIQNVGAKIGGTAGWLVGAADDVNSLSRLPAGETASTLVIPLQGLKVGDTITSYLLYGQIESGGNTATLDAALRKQSASSPADLTDAAVSGGGMTQVSATEDTLVANGKSGLSVAVAAAESYYLLLTGTTAALTDIDLLSVVLTVTEA